MAVTWMAIGLCAALVVLCLHLTSEVERRDSEIRKLKHELRMARFSASLKAEDAQRDRALWVIRSGKGR